MFFSNIGVLAILITTVMGAATPKFPISWTTITITFNREPNAAQLGALHTAFVSDMWGTHVDTVAWSAETANDRTQTMSVDANTKRASLEEIERWFTVASKPKPQMEGQNWPAFTINGPAFSSV